MILFTTTIEAREALEKNGEWVTETFLSARVLRQTFLVVAHGFRLSAIDVNNQKAVIEKITRENAGLHEDLEVIRISWPHFALREVEGVKK